MKIRFRYLLPVLILAAASMGYKALAGRAMPPETKTSPERPLEAEVRPVRLQTIRPEISAYGTVTPASEATLVAEVSGRVIRVVDALVAGGVFLKGEVMLELEPSDYRAAVAAAAATLARVQRELAAEQERGRQARIDWEDLGQGVPTELAIRKPQLTEAAAQVKAAEAALENAKRNLVRTRILAPYTGLVTRREVTLGGYVSAGGPVATLAGLDRAEIRLLVPASDAALLDLPATGHNRLRNPVIGPKGRANSERKQMVIGNRASAPGKSRYAAGKSYRTKTETIQALPNKGQEVRITQSDGNSARTGRIVRTEGTVDPETRLICVVVSIDDPYGIFGKKPLPQLLFGSFVTAGIKGVAVEDAVVLAPHLVGEDGRVWTVSRDDRLRLKPVSILRREQERVIVTGGLISGERISMLRFPEGMEGRSVLVRAENSRTAPDKGAIADANSKATARAKGDRS